MEKVTFIQGDNEMNELDIVIKDYNELTAKRRKLGKKMKYMDKEDKSLEKKQLELLKKYKN